MSSHPNLTPVLILCAASLVLPLSLGAQVQNLHQEGRYWVGDIHGTAASAPSVKIRLDQGDIHVEGQTSESPQSTADYVLHLHTKAASEEQARRRFSDATLKVTSSNGTLELHSDGWVDLVLRVPASISLLDVHTDSGSISINHLSARTRATTDAGGITLEQIAGKVDAKTDGGNIVLHNSGAGAVLETGAGNILIDAAGGDVKASTGGGNVQVTAAKGSVVLNSGGGNLTVHQSGGALKLETGGGNVDVGDAGAGAQLRTSSGTIRLASSRGPVTAETGAGSIDCRQLGGGLRAETGAGSIYAEYSRTPQFAESHIETGSGDVQVFVPALLAAAVHVKVDGPWGHSIHVDFPSIHVSGTGEDGLHAEGLLNGGGPLLLIETASGNVELNKLH